MAILNLNYANVINVHDSINANNVHFNLYNTDKLRGAFLLTMCRNIVTYYVGYWGAGGGWVDWKKGWNAPWDMDSQRCKSSASRVSFQHCRGRSDCTGHITIGDFCCLWES
jgi:hypothetical protein